MWRTDVNGIQLMGAQMQGWRMKPVLLVIALMALSLSASRAPAETAVLMTWGGIWQKTFEKVAADFHGKTGHQITVVAQTNADAALARLSATRGRPDVDLWTPNMVNYSRAVKAKLLAPLPGADAIPNLADIPTALRFPYGVSAWVSQRGILYRRDLVPFVPRQWSDLWDPRLDRKMAAPSATFDAGLFPLMAAVTSGGSEKALEPGFSKLKEVSGRFTAFYTSNVQSIRMLESGEVALIAWGVLPNVIQYLGPDSKYAFAIPQPAFVAETPVTIVEGTKKTALAVEFINYLLSPDVQHTLSSAFGSTPANSKSPIPKSLTDLVGQIPANYVVDYDALSDVLPDVIDRYERQIMSR